MPNSFEQIAENKRRAALAKQDADVERFARKVADEVSDKISDLSLKDSIAQLAATVAQSIVASNGELDTSLKDNFSQLLAAVQANKPDDSTQIELSIKIGQQLASLEEAFNKIELAPQIHLEAATAEDLKTEVGKILARLSEDSQRIVSIAYENANPDKYINVRLTDGFKFYTARGGTVVTGGGGGATGGLTDAELRASPVPVTATIDTTGLATSTKQDATNALLTTIDTHVDGLEALATATNTKLDTLHTDVDGLEATNAAILAAQKVEWGLNDKENTGTYLYYGLESASGAWKLIRKTIATNVFRYATGASGYAAAWTGRAGQTYDTFGTTF